MTRKTHNRRKVSRSRDKDNADGFSLVPFLSEPPNLQRDIQATSPFAETI